MAVAIIAITQLSGSRRNASSIPKAGIHGTLTSRGASARVRGSIVASHTAEPAGTNASR